MLKRRRLLVMLFVVVSMLALGANFAVMADAGEKIQLRYVVPENQTLVYEVIRQDISHFDEVFEMPMPIQITKQREVYSIAYGETQEDGTTPFVIRMLEVEIDGINLADVYGEDGLGSFMELSGYMNDQGGVEIEKISFPLLDELSDLLGIDIDLNEILPDNQFDFPDEPIAVGDSWYIKDSFPLKGIPLVERFDVDAEGTITLAAIEVTTNTATIREDLTISGEILMSITQEDEPTLPSDISFHATLEGGSEGSSIIDIHTGQPVSSEMVMSQVLRMHISIPGMPGTEQTGTITAITKMERRLIDRQ